MNLLASIALSVALNEADARKVAALMQRAVDAEAEVERLRAFIERTKLACGLALLPEDCQRSTSVPPGEKP